MNTVLITGASSGFGAAAAEHFADAGWNVLATMRAPGAAPASLLNHDRVAICRLDVIDPKSIEAAVAEGVGRFGRLDAVVNNAGYGVFSIFEDVPRDAIQRQFDVNVFGAMDVIRAVLPQLRAQGEGTIINVTSGAGVFGAPMGSVYSASKFALEGFSEALWHEMRALGIRVKLIEPGGAPGTQFLARSGHEAAAIAPNPAYGPFVAHMAEVYAGMGAGSDPDAIQKVAAAIFDAANDGTDRLRYTPTQDVKPLLDARRGSSEEHYLGLIRQLFAPPAA